MVVVEDDDCVSAEPAPTAPYSESDADIFPKP